MRENTAAPVTLRKRLYSTKKDRLFVLTDKPMFLMRASELLKEGYTIHECFSLLLPHHSANSLSLITKVEDIFREGANVSEVLRALGFPDRILLSIELSENDGRLAEALNGASIRLKAAEERKQKFIQAATYPVVLMFAMGLLLIAFKIYFLPNFETLATSRSTTTQGVEKYLPRIVAKAPDFLLAVFGAGGLLFVIGKFCLRRLHPEAKIKKLLKIPIVGDMYSNVWTRLFASETGNLLGAGNSIQEAMLILMKQKTDPILAQVALSIHEEASKGEPFHIAIDFTDGLTRDLSFFAKHGSDSGHLAKELLLYSEQLGNEIDRKVNRMMAMLQPILFVILAVCIIAAYLALLLPVYGMIKNM
ncbi:competence type IV pilus assembly protein ComGB [Sporosarcina gallistercoris]|uniref:Type II secretion system F family protein n=1 Tax=Sporosarcina gallistercoris TaxID=2762245 RepID=A0ABR8PF65_9BACL|nr:competence type IV pilus assembly protein ComGB [Sporosarcina gallistercoris]MBD7906815.1 type II secretion system F family protein [Sporosarcina gallistercoris]